MMSEGALKELAQSILERYLRELPPDLSRYQEAIEDGGRSFFLSREKSLLSVHVAYGSWYKFYLQGGHIVMGEGCAPSNEEFLALLAWLDEVPEAALASHVSIRDTKLSLLADLEKAFPDYGLDGGVSVSQAFLDDDYESGDAQKMRDAYNADETDSWRDVSEATLERFEWMSVFTYLDAKGWKFYLPATMRSVLRDPNSKAACEFYTRISLLPGGEEDFNLSRFAEFLQLTDAQGTVIARYLLFIKMIEPDWFVSNKKAASQLQEWVERYLGVKNE